MATWYYGPWSKGDDEKTHYFCDECVSRGCSCQIDSDTGLARLDRKGRELPCVEFSNYPNGCLIIPSIPSRFRKRPPGDLRKRYDGPQRFDRREWHGDLRRWIKKPVDWWRPGAIKRVRNSLVATRLMKVIYPMLMAIKAQKALQVVSEPVN
jgi:hypothetical protein